MYNGFTSLPYLANLSDKGAIMSAVLEKKNEKVLESGKALLHSLMDYILDQPLLYKYPEKLIYDHKVLSINIPNKGEKIVIAPQFWDDRACYIAGDKYFKKINITETTFARHLWNFEERKFTFDENSVYDLISCVAWHVSRMLYLRMRDDFVDDKEGVKKLKNTVAKFFKQLFLLLIQRYFAFNSPVWFNVGHGFYYVKEMLFRSDQDKLDFKTVTSGDGYLLNKIIIWSNKSVETLVSTFDWDIERIISSGEKKVFGYEGGSIAPEYMELDRVSLQDPLHYPQISACYIIGIEDTIEAIFNAVTTSAKIFRFGSGAGMDWSKLRHAGAKLSNGGTASGPVSFMKVVDATGGVMKSGGRTRRSAIMFTLSADHPDIEEFITMKKHEEDKAHTLANAGYDATSVWLQNANVSVRISDAFMGNYLAGKEREAKLINLIAEGIWRCGDPGIQFSDMINKYRTTKVETINSSNPCSEYLWFDNTSCNLASINLEHIENIVDYKTVIDTAIISMDCLLDMGGFPSDDICYKTLLYRTLGLGICNLGKVILESCCKYGSPKSLFMTAAYCSYLTAEAMTMSNLLGKCFGKFHCQDYSSCEDLLNIYSSRVKKWLDFRTDNGLTDEENNFMTEYLIEAGKKFNNLMTMAKDKSLTLRNAQLTCIAPTGTIGLFMGCETTGVEPILSIVYDKYLVGGGKMRIVANSVLTVLNELYSPSHVDKIKDKLLDGEDVGNLVNDEHKLIFATAWPNGICKHALTYEDHINVLSAAQEFINMGISKTINLPEHASVEDIKKAIELSYTKGVKCVAIYRDNSKAYQPLQKVKTDKEDENKMNNVDNSDPDYSGEDKYIIKRRKLPQVRNAIVRKFKVNRTSGYLIVGINPEDGMPGEIFINISKEGSTLAGLLAAFGITFSIALQYGVPLEVLCRKLSYMRFEPHGFTGDKDIPQAFSIIDYIARRLAKDFLGDEKYNTEEKKEDMALSGRICESCGAQMLAAGTCFVCSRCGETSGCG